MIRMEMCDEYPFDRKARSETHHLALRSFATVKKELVRFTLHRNRTHIASDSRPGRRSS
jgi:hypothetical protein